MQHTESANQLKLHNIVLEGFALAIAAVNCEPRKLPAKVLLYALIAYPAAD